MRRIAIINQKGGVGKTTSTVNIGTALARAGQRVLLIDLDPQANLSMHLGIELDQGKPGVYELLTDNTTIAKVRRKVSHNLWVVGSSIDLAAAEVELVSVVGREVILRDILEQHTGNGTNTRRGQYDYVLMDCPPSLGVLTLNGLCAAQELVIPLQPHYLALQGLGKLMETILLVTKRVNPELKVGGIVVCMNDAGTKLATEVVEDVSNFLAQAKGTDVPWASAKIFETMIRRNIKLAEAPSYGKSIFDYAPDSNGAKDYERLSLEIHDPASYQALIAQAQVSKEKSKNSKKTKSPAKTAVKKKKQPATKTKAPAKNNKTLPGEKDAQAEKAVMQEQKMTVEAKLAEPMPTESIKIEAGKSLTTKDDRKRTAKKPPVKTMHVEKETVAESEVKPAGSLPAVPPDETVQTSQENKMDKSVAPSA